MSRVGLLQARVDAWRAARPLTDAEILASLTPRQAEILDFIRNAIHDTGIPPSLREIGKRFGIVSTNGATDHLLALERKGAIKLGTGAKSRAIKVLVGPCPMCGGAR